MQLTASLWVPNNVWWRVPDTDVHLKQRQGFGICVDYYVEQTLPFDKSFEEGFQEGHEAGWKACREFYDAEGDYDRGYRDARKHMREWLNGNG